MDVKKEEGTIKTVINVTRTFGTQTLMEIYSDYVANQIRDTLRSQSGK